MYYTVYIRKRNEELFKAEENKADLINTLLELHYKEQLGYNEQVAKDYYQPPVAQTEHEYAKTDSGVSDEEFNAVTDAGLEYVRPGIAWSSERENNVPYKFINGKVVLG